MVETTESCDTVLAAPTCRVDATATHASFEVENMANNSRKSLGSRPPGVLEFF